MRKLVCLLLAALPALAAEPIIKPASNADPEGKVGERPYEMVWADRKPAHVELVDFEDLTGWTAAGFLGCTVDLYRSREEQMFGTYTAKAVYKGETAASYFELRPPRPIAIPGKPTAAQMWVRGNNWGWHPKPRTARTRLTAVVHDARGEAFDISLGSINYDYWFLTHATFVSPTGGLVRVRAQGGDGTIDYPLSFVALRITGCADDKLARLSFDSLQFYIPAYRPVPELKLPPADQPWPTTPDTITPTPKEEMRTSVRQDGDSYVLEAKGQRDQITWIYRPAKGTLDDLTVEINGRRFQPCAGGGPVFLLEGGECRAGDEGVTMRLAAAQIDGGLVRSHWQVSRGNDTTYLRYILRPKGKSLQITVAETPPPEPVGHCTAFRIGHTAGTPGAESFSVPYLSFDHTSPHVVHWDGVFLSALLDWYHSDGSVLDAEQGRLKPDQLIYNGGSRYLPKTDGTRNPLRERLIVTVASDFHEVLPHIPHPRNPQAEKAVGAIWRNIGAPNEDLLKRLKAHGVERFICPLHEIGWRDAGESFTFRLAAAPRIGDEKMKAYGDWVKGLGYRFGLYSNYTDFAPVNGNWSEDRVCLDSDGNWRGAWPRCYAPKPTYAWQAEADLAPKIAAKFGSVTCYSDVHTAIPPWARTDYDARVPGAGMLRATWQCYAQVLWNECRSYGGPVFSEGRAHWFYAGLVTGNYAQITGAERWRQPPLVDFDLLKMHPLMTDFGMGAPSMFYDRHGTEWRRDRSRTSPWLDRFLTSTLAFGHIGFLPLEWGFDGALKAFYMTNAVQQHYALVPVEAIRYFDGQRLLTTSEAIRTGAHRRGQVYVRYRSGLQLWCNLSFEGDWHVECDGTTYVLPPTGHVAFLEGTLLQYSAMVDGRRMDYVKAPDYVYVDTRDRLAAVGPVVCKGAVAIKPLDEADAWAVIPATACDELSLRPVHLGLEPSQVVGAEALDLEGTSLGPAEVRVSNLGQTIFPVNGAVRYRIRPVGTALVPRPDETVRRIVAGLARTARVGIVDEARGDLEAARLLIEWVRPDGTTRQVGEDVLPARIRRRREHARVIAVPMPAEAKVGERQWFRVRVTGHIRGRPAEGSAWYTAIAAPALDVMLRPEDASPRRPGSRQALVLTFRSNCQTRKRVTIEAVSPALDLAPATATQDLSEGETATLSLGYDLPDEPAVVPIELRFAGYLTPAERAMAHMIVGAQELDPTKPLWTMTVKRWLRVTKARTVAIDLTKLQTPATRMALRGEAEEPLRSDSGAQFYASRRPVGGVEKAGFFCHPPYKGGVGYAVGEFEVALPDEACAFETYVGFSDGSSTADGCVFSVQVRVGDQTETVGTAEHATLERWKAFRCDLTKFRGKTVALRLVTDVGPQDNSSSDWAVWGEPRVVLAGERLLPEVFETKPILPIGPPPVRLEGLKAGDLATVVEAKVVLDGCGVDSGKYRSDVYLNGLLIGHTPGSTKGDTAWTEQQAVAVPPAALETIGPRNVVAIRNPRLDYFKVRRIHLWFRLADGREGTSAVVNGPLTTPPGWDHAEGILVPHGQEIVAECDIPVAK